MKRIMIRGFRAVVDLMRRALGLRGRRAGHDVVGHSLDDFIGSWSETRERELLDAISDFEKIDGWQGFPSGRLRES